MALKPCPCGKVPERLKVHACPDTLHWTASVECCGWQVMFRPPRWPNTVGEARRFAEEAWNAAPRAGNVKHEKMPDPDWSDFGTDLGPMKPEEESVVLSCLYCGKKHSFEPDSAEANGVFNVFCDDGCEDKYAATL